MAQLFNKFYNPPTKTNPFGVGTLLYQGKPPTPPPGPAPGMPIAYDGTSAHLPYYQFPASGQPTIATMPVEMTQEQASALGNMLALSSIRQNSTSVGLYAGGYVFISSGAAQLGNLQNSLTVAQTNQTFATNFFNVATYWLNTPWPPGGAPDDYEDLMLILGGGGAAVVPGVGEVEVVGLLLIGWSAFYSSPAEGSPTSFSGDGGSGPLATIDDTNSLFGQGQSCFGSWGSYVVDYNTQVQPQL